MLTLHHLETSRSSRVIWLLEALGVDYELVTHKRGPDMRAGADLKAVHPLGKAPTLVDGDLVIAESATILRYLSERYGQGRFRPPAGSSAQVRHDEWLDYAESSLMTPLMINLLGLIGGGLPPALEHFAAPELDKALGFIEARVEKSPYLAGDDLTLSDMQMSFCLALAEAGGFLKDSPALQAYWGRLQQEPSFVKAIKIGGPLVSLGAAA